MAMKKITSTIFICFLLIFNLNSQKSITIDNVNLKSSKNKSNLPAYSINEKNINSSTLNPLTFKANLKPKITPEKLPKKYNLSIQNINLL